MKGRSVPARYFSFLIIMFSLAWGAVAGYAGTVDRIVAIVNDDCIALSELKEALAPYIEQIRAANYPSQVEREMLFKLRQDVLNRMIDQKLTQQETERQNVKVDDKEIDQQIERIKSQHLLTDEELRASLAREGYTLEESDKEKMRAANEILYIHPEECIDCGACEPECPVEAIFPDDEVPEEWQEYIEKNNKRFGL